MGFSGLNSSFFRAVATLSSGQLVAAIIPFLVAPLLGRLYLPSDYALFASYLAIANVAIAAVTLQYHHGIVAERSERRAELLVSASLYATLGVSAIMAALGVILVLSSGLFLRTIGGTLWPLLLPVTTAVTGAFTAAAALANRRQQYGLLARMQLVSALLAAATSLICGLRGFGPSGLMLAHVAGLAVSLAFTVRILARGGGVRRFGGGIRKVYLVAARHRFYPIFTLPAALLNSVSVQLPVFLLMAIGANPILGSFNRAQQLTSLPVTLFSAALGRVYFQRAASDYNERGTCRPLFLKTALLIAAAGLPPLAALALFGPLIFTVYLGPSWSVAGSIAQILAPMIFLQMLTAPLGSVFLLTGNQRLGFGLNVVGLTLALAGCGMVLLAGGTAFQLIATWAAAICVQSSLQLAVAWRLSLRGA